MRRRRTRRWRGTFWASEPQRMWRSWTAASASVTARRSPCSSSVYRSPAASVASSSAASVSLWCTATSTAASASTAVRYISTVVTPLQQQYCTTISTLCRCNTTPTVHLAWWCSTVLSSGHPKTSAFLIDRLVKVSKLRCPQQWLRLSMRCGGLTKPR